MDMTKEKALKLAAAWKYLKSISEPLPIKEAIDILNEARWKTCHLQDNQYKAEMDEAIRVLRLHE